MNEHFYSKPEDNYHEAEASRTAALAEVWRRTIDAHQTDRSCCAKLIPMA